MEEVILHKSKNKYFNKTYYCEITDVLDSCFKLFKTTHPILNYVYDSRDIWDGKTIAIRIPGRTSGYIKINEDNIILECVIHDDLVGKNNWYDKNVNEKLKKFIGKKLVFSE